MSLILQHSTVLVRHRMCSYGATTGRGVWDSERVFRSWLTDDGCLFANDDLGPALATLEASGPYRAVHTRKNVARRGWLITNAVDGHESPVEGTVDVQPITA